MSEPISLGNATKFGDFPIELNLSSRLAGRAGRAKYDGSVAVRGAFPNLPTSCGGLQLAVVVSPPGVRRDDVSDSRRIDATKTVPHRGSGA